MRKIIAATTTILLVICFSTVSAHADRKTMEGFILGTGAVLLGTAIYNGIHHNSNVQFIPQKTVNYEYSHNRHNNYRYDYKGKHNKKYRRNDKKSHWIIQREWVDPIYEKKWNPGHYNRKGQWISSRNENFLIRQGYWQEKKVWVRH